MGRIEREKKYKDFRSSLTEAGWKCYNDSNAGEGQVDFYACLNLRGYGARDCCLNDMAPLFIARLYHFYPGIYGNANVPDSASAEIAIEGQAANGDWIRLRVSRPWDDLLDKAELDKIINALVSGYNITHDAFSSCAQEIA